MFKSIRGALVATTAPLLVGACLLSTVALIPVTARALELIPSIGTSKATDANADDATFSGGLAIRAPVLPFLKLEGGITYRQDSYYDNDLAVRMWPVTASAWLTPFPMVYAGGGLGWYRTTYDYDSALPFEDTTTNQVGVHIGGGVLVPMGTNLGLDFNGRYIFMQADDELALPTTFDPDFWSASLGLSIQF